MIFNFDIIYIFVILSAEIVIVVSV